MLSIAKQLAQKIVECLLDSETTGESFLLPKRRRRLAVYYHDDVLENRGSASAYVKRLCSSLSEYFEIALFVYARAEVVSVHEMDGYLLYRTPLPRFPGLSSRPDLLGKVFRAILAHHPRLFLFSKEAWECDFSLCFDSYSGFTVAALSRISRRQVIYRPNDELVSLGTEFGSSGHRTIGFLLASYGILAESFLVAAASLILIPSRKSAADFARFPTAQSKLMYCPYCVKFEETKSISRSRIRDELGLPGEKTILIFVGNGNWLPNQLAIEYIIRELAPYLSKRFPQFFIVIVGRGTHSYRVLINTSNVMIVGEVKDVAPYLAAADVGLAPLRMIGGIPAKIIEYLANGLPTLATKNVEYIMEPQVGLHFCDLDKYTEALAGLVESEITDESRELIMNQARAKYSIDQEVKQIACRILSLR